MTIHLHQVWFPPKNGSHVLIPCKMGPKSHKLSDFTPINGIKKMGNWGEKLVGGITPCTLRETNSSHLIIGHPKRKLVFQPSIFRCELLVFGFWGYITGHPCLAIERCCSWSLSTRIASSSTSSLAIGSTLEAVVSFNIWKNMKTTAYVVHINK